MGLSVDAAAKPENAGNGPQKSAQTEALSAREGDAGEGASIDEEKFRPSPEQSSPSLDHAGAFPGIALWIVLALFAVCVLAGGYAFWLIGNLKDAVADLRHKVVKLDAAVQRAQAASAEPQRAKDPLPAPPEAARRQAGRGYKDFDVPPAGTRQTEPRKRLDTGDIAAEAPEKTSFSRAQLTSGIDALRDELTRLIGGPGMRTADYDAVLRRFGNLHGIEIAGDGARLTDADSDPNRRLSAVAFADSTVVAIVPSARFVRDFDLTYKESLEAGADVKSIFTLQADGSATLRIERLASAIRDAEGNLAQPTHGVLGGFFR
ncbi:MULTISPECIES: hypothetical protein [unclassified Novosphingobium]|uniref:hypothetical protein n=1 Tax=unclassified Novosphingobium TaxID=2644732 RepID=UPI00135C5D74|nr:MULTISPECIES: hypothetical protein [unclassified Novosphingobium]